MGPIGDGVGLYVGTPEEAHGEDCSSMRQWWDPWRMDLQAFLEHLHLMMCTQVSYVVTFNLPVPQVWPPTACPITTMARHPLCQEPHVLTPPYSGILVEEDFPGCLCCTNVSLC